MIKQGDAADTVQNALHNVEDRYKDVIILEAAVAELHQMFVDLALLVEKQGEFLDQIEHQVGQASEMISDANTNMVQAIEYQKSIRYKQCILLIIVLVVLGIIGGVIAAKMNGAF